MKEIIKNITDENRLSEIWCELNSWRIPKELRDLIEPQNVGQVTNVMREITGKIGKEKCLKEWNRRQNEKSIKSK